MTTVTIVSIFFAQKWQLELPATITAFDSATQISYKNCIFWRLNISHRAAVKIRHISISSGCNNA